MNSRLKSPLMAVAISGALVAGGAVYAAPASASGSASLSSRIITDNPTSPVGLPTDPGAALDRVAARIDAARRSHEAGVSALAVTTVPSAPVQKPADATPPVNPGTEPEPTQTPAPTSTPEPPPPADTTPPTGHYSVTPTAVWIGDSAQSITLTETSLSDDVSKPEQITRQVLWGDGTSTTLAAGQQVATKSYAKAGKWTVSVKLTDAAGNAANATVDHAVVTVTTPVVKVKVSKAKVWNHESFKVTLTALPKGATKVELDRGDGYTATLKKNKATKVSYHFYRGTLTAVSGVVVLRARVFNANGPSALVTVGKIKIKKDKWKPVIKIKKPAKANRASSWKSVGGTVSDKGSGLAKVEAIIMNASVDSIGNVNVYCFAGGHWKNVTYADSDAEFLACVLHVKVKKGKWSVKIKRPKRGALVVGANAVDWSGKEKTATVRQTLAH